MGQVCCYATGKCNLNLWLQHDESLIGELPFKIAQTFKTVNLQAWKFAPSSQSLKLKKAENMRVTLNELNSFCFSYYKHFINRR